MWGWIVLAVLAGILLLPLQLVAAYDSKGGRVYIRFAFLVWNLYPGKDESEEKPEKKSETPQATADDKPAGSKLESWIDFFFILKSCLKPLDQLRQQINVDDLKLQLSLAKDDPYDLSVLYGRACAVVSDLQVLLNRIFKIKKQNVEVLCDYVGNKTTVQAYTRISITCIRFLVLLFRYGASIIKEYTAVKNRRKGGMINEQKPT